MNNKKLNIVWSNADPISSEKMVMMYSINSMLNNWWEEVQIIVWGAPAKLLAENEILQEKVKQAEHVGVKISVCKSCADQLGVSEKIEELGVDLRYWGEGLTEIIKDNGKLITI